MNESGQYYFTGVPYNTDINTFEVTFTISDVSYDTEIPDDPDPVDPDPVDPDPADPPSFTKTNISSIRYDFSIAGITDETSLTINSTSSNWSNVSATFELSDDGDYSATLDFDNSEGLINLGFFTVVSGSAITANVNKITVNDTVELSVDADLLVGIEGNNGMNNIWNTEAGAKVAIGANGYIELNSDKSALEFYSIAETPEPAPTPVAKNITSIQYEFAISGINGESQLTFKNQTLPDWAERTSQLELSTDGNYVVSINLGNVEGFTNLGYFNTIVGSAIKANLTKIIINNVYELNIDSLLEINDSNKNGIKNIWNSPADLEGNIAEGTNCFIAYDKDKNSIQFYTVE